jgi:hypothetical protein
VQFPSYPQFLDDKFHTHRLQTRQGSPTKANCVLHTRRRLAHDRVLLTQMSLCKPVTNAELDALPSTSSSLLDAPATVDSRMAVLLRIVYHIGEWNTWTLCHCVFLTPSQPESLGIPRVPGDREPSTASQTVSASRQDRWRAEILYSPPKRVLPE